MSVLGAGKLWITRPYSGILTLRQDSEWRDGAGFNGRRDRIPAVNLLMQWESSRQGCLNIDLLSGDGVVEFQILGVQEISSVTGEAGEIFKRLAG